MARYGALAFQFPSPPVSGVEKSVWWTPPRAPVLQTLLSRRSVSPRLLMEPAPSTQDLRLMVAAALRAPDHGRLRPWCFVSAEGMARERLGDVFASAFAARHPDATAEQLTRERAKPCDHLWCWTVGAAITTDHPTVRIVDQHLADGAAAMNLLNAAHALGFAGMWLTGESCHDPAIKRALGLRPEDFIAGWLYLGTAMEDVPEHARPDPASFLHIWEEPT